MKTKKRQNRERGAIAVITALSITFFIACAALAVDIGLQCYKGAKLQNAVDSAATAVAQQIGSVGSADDDVAYDYLAQNGFDKDSNQYQGKIKVTIEKKGQLDQSTTQDENDYITTGYYKITADVDQRSGFMSMMGIDYFHIKKTAYVKADAQYTDMPKALKYTLFADSTEGTDAMPAMQIDGRTKSTLNDVTSRFEGIINGTSILVGKIGHYIFGTDVNYNPLVNINLSEVITNGDVHSNSNITIGVQALNASRTKDYDVDANETNSSAAEESTTDKDEEADDYGQVTYTAGTSITFDNSLRETGTQSTHVYVQNQQYVEITGAALKVIKSLDATKSESEIRNDFETEMIKYLRTHGLSVNSDDYKNIIKNQKNNIYKESDGRILLKDQSSIVYNIDHQTANKYLQEVRDNDGNVTAIASASGVDVLTNGTDLLYKNVGDTANDFSYDANNVEVSSIGETTIKNRITVTGKQVNRSLITAKKYGRLDTDGVNNTTTGARFAITRTFLENSDYISAPNMKPYFVRAIRSSVKKATEVEGNKNTGTDNIKQAVADAQSKLKTYLANVKKNLTDSTKNNEESTNTDLLFKYNKENKDSGLTENSDNKTYKGYDLYERDEDGNFTNQLRTPETYVDDYQNSTVNKQKSSVVVENYRKKNIDGKYSDSRVDSFYEKNVDGKFGPAKVIEFFNKNIDGKYASDKVSSAKADIIEKESYSAHQVKTEAHTFFDFASNERSIFLAPKNVTMGYTTPGENLEKKINMNTSGFDSIKTPISSTNVIINEPDISQKGIVDYTKAEPKVTVGSKEYKAEEIVSGTVDTAKVVTDRAAETTWKQGSNTLDDHNQYRWITEGGSTSGLAIGRNWWGLQDYSTYKLKHGHFDDGDRGLRMGKDEQLYLTDYYRHTGNKKMFFANTGNTFIIGGENKFTQDNVEYAYYSPKASMEFKESGNTVVVNGNMSVAGISFKNDTENNVLIVNGDLNISGEIFAESGAEYIIVVTGKITCKQITVPENSTLVAGGIDANLDNDGAVTVNSLGTTSGDKNIVNNGDLRVNNNCVVGTVSNSKTGTMYVGGNVAAKSDLTNDNKVKIIGNLTVGDNIKNTPDDGSKPVLQIGGHALCSYFNNRGEFRCGGDLCATGNANFSSDSYTIAGTVGYPSDSSKSMGTIYQNGVLYVTTGDMKTSGSLQVGGTVYVKNGSIDTYSDMIAYSNALIYVNNNMKVGGKLTLQGSKVYVGNEVKADDLATSAGTEIHFKNLNVSFTWENLPGSKVYVSGDISSYRIINSGIIYVNPWSLIGGTGTATIRYLHNNSGAEFICNGNLEVTSYDMTDNKYKYCSVTNFGGVYINGNLTTDYSVYNENGIMYVRGNMSLCNNYYFFYGNRDDSVSLSIQGYSGYSLNLVDGGEVYVSGCVTSPYSGRKIGITGNESSDVLFSVYGKNNNCAFSTNVTSFTNGQKNSKVYLGSGSSMGSGSTLRISGTFINEGKMYIYTALRLSSNSYFRGQSGSATYVREYLDVGGKSVTIQDGHTLMVFDSANCGSLILEGTSELYVLDDIDCSTLSASDGSQVYSNDTINCSSLNVYDSSQVRGVKALNNSSGNMVIESDGYVYCGPKSKTPDGNTWTLKYSKLTGSNPAFKGQFYFPGKNEDITLKLVDASNEFNTAFVFDGGVFVTDANITLDSTTVAGIPTAKNITMKNSSKVYIGGKSTFDHSNIVNNSGKLFLMDDISISSAATDFVFNSDCTNYIAPVSIDGANKGVLKLQKCFYANGTNYIDNSVVANTSTSYYESNDSNKSGYRYISIDVGSGETHISGNLSVANNSRGTFVAKNAVLSCNDFSTYSVVYNRGKFIILGNYSFTSTGEFSDIKGGSKVDFGAGYSLKNGISDDDTDALMYVGGSGTTDFGGAYQNHGTYYQKGDMIARGWITDSDTIGYTAYFGILVEKNAKSCFGGNVSSDNSLLTASYTEFSCSDYATRRCIYNRGGKVIILNDLDMSNNSGIPSNADDSGFSIRNGGNGSGTATESVMYVGGDYRTKLDGCFQNWGQYYQKSSITINGAYYNSDMGYGIYCGILNQSGAITHFGGDVLNRNALLNLEDTEFSCQNLTEKRGIYNKSGKVVILQNLDFQHESGVIAEDLDSEGFTIRNGGTGEKNCEKALMFIGGTNEYTMDGAFQNWGEYYQNGSANIEGWHKNQAVIAKVDTPYAVIFQQNSKTYFNGSLYCNWNGVLTVQTAFVFVEGNLEFGTMLANMGTTYVTGDIATRDTKNHSGNKVKYNSQYCTIRNGALSYNTDNNLFEDAVLFCGGTMTLGSSESGGEAGSVMNVGTMYVKSHLYDYCNKDNSYYRTAFWMWDGSNTFIGGDCFGGGAMATGNNSIFMVGGDLLSKRAVKINVHFDQMYYLDVGNHFTYRTQNKYTPAYFYVGGNMYANTTGKKTWYWLSSTISTRVPENYSRQMDVYSNSNVYVGGTLYAYSGLELQENATVLVEGNKKMYNGSVDEAKLFNDDTRILDKLRILNDLKNDSVGYGCYVAQSYEQEPTARLIVNGSMHVEDTAKIRDLTQLYVYGNFDGDDYVEVGKALDGADETEAKETLWRKDGDNDNIYRYANAPKMFVKGNFSSGKYTRLYAGTTFTATGNFVSSKYLTLRHDVALNVGGNLETLTSIDVGSYSDFNVGGYVRAYLSNIKIRDCVNSSIGGDLIAYTSYIELGKSGDYIRDYKIDTSEGGKTGYDTNEKDDSGDKNKDSTDAGNDKNGGRYCYSCNKIWKNDEVSDNKCPGCGKYLVSASYYCSQDKAYYLITDLNTSSTKYFCNVCGNHFTSSQLDGGKCPYCKYKCSTCNRILSDDDVYYEVDDNGDPKKDANGNIIYRCKHCCSQHGTFSDGTNCATCNANGTKVQGTVVSKLDSDSRITPFREKIVCPKDGKELAPADETSTDADTVNPDYEYSSDASDKSRGSTFRIGGSLTSYTGYIKIFARTTAYVGKYVFTPKYLTVRHNADLWVLPEMFGNNTYTVTYYQSTLPENSTLWDKIKDTIGRIKFEITEATKLKNGSVYSLGQMTLNKTATLMGSWDAISLGQCVLRPDSLVYMGHDFRCSANSLNISLDSIKGKTSLAGFDSQGTAEWCYKFKCKNTSCKHTFNIPLSTVEANEYVQCPYCHTQNKSADGIKNIQQGYPVVVYADHEIDISTTIDMKLTYLVANEGDVNLYDIYSKSDNAEKNAKDLPNAVCSYQSDVNYFAMYGKIGALFYAPNGLCDMDGYYQEIWGSIIGKDIVLNTYYLTLHRFTNWRTMDLHMVESGTVSLVSEKEWKNASDNTGDLDINYTKDDEYPETGLPKGAHLFFDSRSGDTDTTD